MATHSSPATCFPASNRSLIGTGVFPSPLPVKKLPHPGTPVGWKTGTPLAQCQLGVGFFKQNVVPKIEVAIGSTSTTPDDIGALDGTEIHRLAELKQPGDQRRFIASRVLLRSLLNRVSPEPVKEWKFEREDSGRWKTTSSPLSISTSHAGEAVAAAVSECGEVGIDVERLDTDLSQLPIDAALSSEEKHFLSRLPALERNRVTILFWTAKEAYAKLQGLGTEIDFASLDYLSLSRRSDLSFVSREVTVLRVPYQVALAFHPREAQAPIRVNFSQSDPPGRGNHGTHATR